MFQAISSCSIHWLICLRSSFAAGGCLALYQHERHSVIFNSERWPTRKQQLQLLDYSSVGCRDGRSSSNRPFTSSPTKRNSALVTGDSVSHVLKIVKRDPSLSQRVLFFSCRHSMSFRFESELCIVDLQSGPKRVPTVVIHGN